MNIFQSLHSKLLEPDGSKPDQTPQKTWKLSNRKHVVRIGV